MQQQLPTQRPPLSALDNTVQPLHGTPKKPVDAMHNLDATTPPPLANHRISPESVARNAEAVLLALDQVSRDSGGRLKRCLVFTAPL
jgi:hypothetical protein